MTCINAEIKSSDCFSDIQYLFFLDVNRAFIHYLVLLEIILFEMKDLRFFYL